MQKLHLVGFTTDLDGLIFSARRGSKAGGYLVPLDKDLLSTIAEAERLRNGDKGEDDGARQRARPSSRLTPREIQAHLRSGRSIPEVAAEAEVDAEWVERFAVPIVAEQAQMVERARAMTYSKARLGQSTQPLGTSVRWNLADKGVAISEDAFEQGWSAFQLQDEVWMIRFRYTSRTRLQVAEWELDLDINQLMSRNRLASELGYVEKGRRPPALPAPAPRPAAAPPVRVTTEVVDDTEPDETPAPAPAPRPAPRRRRRTPRPTARKKPAPKKSAPRKKSAARKKSTARTAPARKSTKRAAPKKATRKAATKRATPKRATPKRATPKKTTARRPARATATKATRRPRARTTTARSSTAPKKAPAPRKRAPARPATATASETTKKQTEAVALVEAPAPPRLAATKARDERRQPRPRPAPAREPDIDEFDVPPAPTPRAEQPRRPRIAASSAKEAASKRPVRPRRAPVRAQQAGRKTNNNDQPAAPSLSGPLARSLLARRLMARKSTQGDGGGKSQRPLRVR